ncbi:MAG: hypothetical protein HQL25_02095 [Candidatus Omnitrophica bacterium]|nr:hypothetical protein [Candidatus Omnitrophota bacterium]
MKKYLSIFITAIIALICLTTLAYAYSQMPMSSNMSNDSIFDLFRTANSNGLSFILLGLILLSIELHIPGHMVSGVGGVISFIAGSKIMFDSNDPMIQDIRIYVFSITFSLAVLLIIMLILAIKAKTHKVRGGQEGLVGETGESNSDISKDKPGKIFVHGELWNAMSENEIKKGDTVIVTKVEGLTLSIRKK